MKTIIMNFYKYLMIMVVAFLIAACSTTSPSNDPTAISLTSNAGSPSSEIRAAAATLLKTKQAGGMLVADKGDNPAKYFDGGIASGEEAKRNLETFDELDFEVFTNQDWVNLHKSHAENIVVSWPDGHETYGIDVHINDLKWLFVHAPDTRIKVHPVRIGTGHWTAVQGVMEGTFTKPMLLADGSTIEPTGNKFSLPMATFAVWKEGKMIHEWLFWDNQTYMKQLGIGQ